jgi:hypothetical protein
MLPKLKDLFIPHRGNNYRPTLLERISVGLMLLLILLSFAMANVQALLWLGSDWLVSSVLPGVIINLTNDERGDEALRELARSDILDRAAKLKAEDMAKGEYFAHYSPSGVSPWYWFEQVDYDYLHAGENLAVHFTESEEVVEAWMKSPTHRANIMNGNYEEIGVGTARGEYKGIPTIYVVQLFGTKKVEVQTAVSTDSPTREVSVERLALTETTSDVLPATIALETATTNPTEETIPTGALPTEIQLQSEPVATIERESEIETLPPEEETVFHNETQTIVLYSDMATSSLEGTAVPLATTPVPLSPHSTSFPLTSATAPAVWLEALYALIAFVIIGVLLASLILEWRHHHPIQTAYAGGLLAVMGSLLTIHEMLTGQVLIM